MTRTVLMQHHPRQGPPLALPPVRAFVRRLSDNALPLQMQLQPGVAPAEAVTLHQTLVKVLDREAPGSARDKTAPPPWPGRLGPACRRFAEPAVQEPGFALLLVAPRFRHAHGLKNGLPRDGALHEDDHITRVHPGREQTRDLILDPLDLVAKVGDLDNRRLHPAPCSKAHSARGECGSCSPRSMRSPSPPPSSGSGDNRPSPSRRGRGEGPSIRGYRRVGILEAVDRLVVVGNDADSADPPR